MGYVYSALWFLTAFLLLCRFRKESVVVYILSAYFVFAGVWWLAAHYGGELFILRLTLSRRFGIIQVF